MQRFKQIATNHISQKFEKHNSYEINAEIYFITKIKTIVTF